MKKYQPDLLVDWEASAGKEPRRAATPGYQGKPLTKNADRKIFDIEGYCKILGKLMWF